FYTSEHGKRPGGTLRIAASCNYQVVSDVQLVRHGGHPIARVVKIGAGFVGQPNDRYVAVLVALVPIREESRLVHAVGTPGSEKLKDDDLVAVLFVGRA